MKNIFSLLFYLLTITSYAQNFSISDILSDDNIPWAGEVMWNVSLDFSMDEKPLAKYGIKGKNELRILKILNNNPTIFVNKDLQFNSTIVQNWKELPLYKDSDLKEVMSFTERDYILSHLDTFAIVNFEIFHEITNVFRTELNSDSLVFYHLKTIVYYDAYSMDFKVMPQAIGIPMNRMDDSDFTNGLRDNDSITINTRNTRKDEIKVIWIPINEWLTTLNINSQNITWATRLYRDLDFGEIKIFKEKQNISVVLKDYFENLSTKMPPLHSTVNGNLFTEKMTKNLVKMRDTIITFDPNTFEEEEKIAVYELNVEDISSIRIVLDWLWDDKKNKLYIKQIAYSPLRKVYENGKFKYKYPLFIKYINQKNKEGLNNKE